MKKLFLLFGFMIVTLLSVSVSTYAETPTQNIQDLGVTDITYNGINSSFDYTTTELPTYYVDHGTYESYNYYEYDADANTLRLFARTSLPSGSYIRVSFIKDDNFYDYSFSPELYTEDITDVHSFVITFDETAEGVGVLIGSATNNDTETYESLTSAEVVYPPLQSINESIFDNIGAIVTGFIGIVIALFANDGVINVFYNDVDGFSLLSHVLFIGFGFFIVKWAFQFIKKLLSLRGAR